MPFRRKRPERYAALPVSSEAASDAFALLRDHTFSLDEEYARFRETQPPFHAYVETLMQRFPVLVPGVRRPEFNDGVSAAHLLLRMAGPNAEEGRLDYFLASLGRTLPVIQEPAIGTIEGRLHSLKSPTFRNIADGVCAPEFAPDIIGGLYEPIRQKATNDYPAAEAFIAGAALFASGVELQIATNQNAKST